MPATKSPGKRPAKTTAAAQAHTRNEKAVAAIDISLEKTQSALASMRSDLGRDGKRIARDVEKLVATTRRDVRKLSRAVISDFERSTRPTTRRKAAAPSARTRGHS